MKWGAKVLTQVNMINIVDPLPHNLNFWFEMVVLTIKL